MASSSSNTFNSSRQIVNNILLINSYCLAQMEELKRMIEEEITICRQQNLQNKPIGLMEVMIHWIKDRLIALDFRNWIQLLEVVYQDNIQRKNLDYDSDTSTEQDNSEEGIGRNKGID